MPSSTLYILTTGLALFISGGVVNGEAVTNCSEQALVSCSDPVTKVDTLNLATTSEQLHAFCLDLSKNLRCIDNYTRHCMHPQQRSLFNQLYSGPSSVLTDICHDGEYKKQYLKHAPCIENVRKDYEQCSSKYQQILKDFNKGLSDENFHKVCCSLKEFIKCTKTSVSKTCGAETAAFAGGYLDRMTSSVLKGCKSSTSEDDCRSSAITVIPTSLVLLIPFYFTLLSYNNLKIQ